MQVEFDVSKVNDELRKAKKTPLPFERMWIDVTDEEMFRRKKIEFEDMVIDWWKKQMNQ